MSGRGSFKARFDSRRGDTLLDGDLRDLARHAVGQVDRIAMLLAVHFDDDDAVRWRQHAPLGGDDPVPRDLGELDEAPLAFEPEADAGGVADAWIDLHVSLR